MFAIVCTLSCSKVRHTDYDLEVNIHEFEIKHSQDIFDAEPEVIIRIETEIESEDSEVYHDEKVNFIEKGMAYNVTLNGSTVDKEILFSVKLYDFDILDAILLSGHDSGEDYIAGAEVKVKIPDGAMRGTVVIDNSDIYLKFTYSIENLKE